MEWLLPFVFRRYGERVIEPEIKLVFLLLLVLMYGVRLGASLEASNSAQKSGA